MNKLVFVLALAGAAAAASWLVQRVLVRGAAPAKPRKPIEDWENEGGALAAQHAPVATSQIPR